jgi:hypothetical protein
MRMCACWRPSANKPARTWLTANPAGLMFAVVWPCPANRWVEECWLALSQARSGGQPVLNCFILSSRLMAKHWQNLVAEAYNSQLGVAFFKALLLGRNNAGSASNCRIPSQFTPCRRPSKDVPLFTHKHACGCREPTRRATRGVRGSERHRGRAWAKAMGIPVWFK